MYDLCLNSNFLYAFEEEEIQFKNKYQYTSFVRYFIKNEKKINDFEYIRKIQML